MKAFTVLELIIVCVILTILASTGAIFYSNIHEKARITEAKSILGRIRLSEESYKLQWRKYVEWDDLDLADEEETPADCNQDTHYFRYGVVLSDDKTTYSATAVRCTTGTGKTPGAREAYTITLDQAGVLTIPEGYQ